MVPVLKTIVDGDIVAYRAAAHKVEVDGVKRECTEIEALEYANAFMKEILAECSFYNETGDYSVYLTGKGNFRFDIAKTAVYKGNRSDKPKPNYLQSVRKYLTDEWGAVTSEGEEADDLIAIDAAKTGYKACVATIDKDMLQIKGLHYNLTKKTFTLMDYFDGLHWFYKQILMGDAADNIKGLHRVGPVKAEDMLVHCSNEKELYQTVVHKYDGDEERVLENARLLWLRRTEGEIWEPPHHRKPKAA